MNSDRDLLSCARPRTECRAPMPMKNRAAQFAPFAALTGYDDAVRETERLTDRRPEISEDRAEILDRRLRWLRDHPEAYDLGECEFHLAMAADDVKKKKKKHEEMGIICFENPEMGIYFIEDPDGYWVEIIPPRK